MTSDNHLNKRVLNVLNDLAKSKEGTIFLINDSLRHFKIGVKLTVTYNPKKLLIPEACFIVRGRYRNGRYLQVQSHFSAVELAYHTTLPTEGDDFIHSLYQQ